MTELYGEAMMQLGELNEMTNKLPDMQRFIKACNLRISFNIVYKRYIHYLIRSFTESLLESKPDKDTQFGW